MTDRHALFPVGVTSASDSLSPAGHARREAMGTMLQGAVRSRRRRRRAARAGVAATFVALFAMFLWPGDDRIPEADPENAIADHDAEIRLEHADFAIVASADDVLARFSAPRRELDPSIFLNDDGLVRCLDEARQPTMVLRTGDALILSPEPELDPFDAQMGE